VSCGTVETSYETEGNILQEIFFGEGEEFACRKRYREQRNGHGLCHGSYLLLIIGGRRKN
jgi:hypothetical protein